MNMNITFIGGGNMATAMAGGLLKNGWPPDSIFIIDVDTSARDRLARELHVRTTPALDALSAVVECIVIAVKPHQVRQAAQALRPFLGSQLVVSIAAGIRLEELSRWLGSYPKVVRVMPNTPALEGAGVSVCARWLRYRWTTAPTPSRS